MANEVAKEDKSYSVEQNLPSKDINFGSSRVVFSHQASGGEKSIDLTNLVVPPDMAANGFSNALPSQIAGAHLSVLRNNLTLISTRGALTPFLDYIVSSSGTINFLPTSQLGQDGALAGEIFTGVIDEKKATGIVVGDVKAYDSTADESNFSIGDTVINVGASYAINKNPTQQVGEIKVYKNGKRLARNVGNAAASPTADGNYHEVDAGNGSGTTIELNVPVQSGDWFGFDFGLMISSGDVQIFSEIERLQASLLKLAGDAAVDFGTNLSDYIAASPAEIERRAFGDLILKMLSAPIPAPSNYQNMYWAQSMSNMLQFTTGDFRFNPIHVFNINTDIEGFSDNLISYADASGGGQFTALKDCRVDVSLSVPIDDNGATARIILNKSFGGGSFQTLWQGPTISGDEEQLGLSFNLGMKAGDRFRFNMSVGQIYSTGAAGYLSILAKEENTTTSLKQILGL